MRFEEKGHAPVRHVCRAFARSVLRRLAYRELAAGPFPLMNPTASRPKTDSLVVSYMGVRRAVGFMGLLLPIILGPIGLLVGIPIQDNMSSYYHTPLRDVFVGTLCAIGVFMFVYRGYTRIENWTANVGCLSALGVALFPLDAGSDPLYQRSLIGYVHTFSGGLFFLNLTVYSLYHFPIRGKEDAERWKDTAECDSHPIERNIVYITSGLVILISLLAMGGYLLLVPDHWKRWLNGYNFLFWMEWVAVWAFAAAWLTKGRTIFAEIAIELMAIPTERIIDRVRPSRTALKQS